MDALMKVEHVLGTAMWKQCVWARRLDIRYHSGIIHTWHSPLERTRLSKRRWTRSQRLKEFHGKKSSVGPSWTDWSGLGIWHWLTSPPDAWRHDGKTSSIDLALHDKLEYLVLEDIIEMVRTLGIGPIRDVGLLDSAVNRPRASAFGEDVYASLSLKAAALLQSMTKNHALVDGNKRLAWLSTVVFCDLNGVSPQLTDDEAFQLVYEVASAQCAIGAIAERLRLGRTSRDHH